MIVGLVAILALSLAATFLLMNLGGESRGVVTTVPTTTTP